MEGWIPRSKKKNSTSPLFIYLKIRNGISYGAQIPSMMMMMMKDDNLFFYNNSNDNNNKIDICMQYYIYICVCVKVITLRIIC